LKVFLDVGANTGQTLMAVKGRFDRIVCFEPAPPCWPHLAKLADTTVRIEHFGLWNRTGEQAIFEPGRKGAGMWKKDKGQSDETQVCRFVRASDWFRENVSAEDENVLKLNVEGAECDILDDLLDSGEFAKVSRVMVDFDVRKITGMKHREAELRERLEPFGFPRVAFCKDVMKGETHQDRIRNWLRLVAA
jgi:FkbM family methyltransferase